MLDRLDQADRISGASAIAALVAVYLPWYRFDDGANRVTANAFGTGFLGDIVFFAALAVALVLLVRHEVIRVELPIDTERIQFVAGGVAMAAVILQLLIGINGSGAFHHATIGIAVAFLAAGGLLVGGWMRRQQPVHSVRRAAHSRR